MGHRDRKDKKKDHKKDKKKDHKKDKKKDHKKDKKKDYKKDRKKHKKKHRDHRDRSKKKKRRTNERSKKRSDNHTNKRSKHKPGKRIKTEDNRNMSMGYRARIDRPDKINPARFPSGFKTTVLHQNPYIVKARRMLNTDEIETVLGMAKGKFERSTIVVDGEMVYSNVRTSETAFITDNGHYEEYSAPVNSILKKVCYLAGCERNQVESLMVVKYGEGEEYYNHHDYFKPEHDEVIEDGGQRIATFFCYLTSLDPEEGGETEFPLIGVKAKPSKGTAVFWWDMKPSGKLLTKTLHRGNPVKSQNKTKYGLNIWIREHGW